MRMQQTCFAVKANYLIPDRNAHHYLNVQNANNLWLLFYSFARLVESLQEDYKARAPYLAYLVNAHQGLLATHSHLERLVERVER